MLRDRRWSTLYKGFTITQRNNGRYYAGAYLYDTMYNTNLNDLKKQINKLLVLDEYKEQLTLTNVVKSSYCYCYDVKARYEKCKTLCEDCKVYN